MKTDNTIVNKSKAFAVRIINLYKYLSAEKKEFVLSKQLLRSGTSIGANVKEAIRGQSREDFAYKMNVSLKEAVSLNIGSSFFMKRATSQSSSLTALFQIAQS